MHSRYGNKGLRCWLALWAIFGVVAMTLGRVSADNYAVAEGHRSLMVAIGCFWCGEQAFEQYAPGVIEVVSGYAGGINDNPTYRNHPGHYEVILIEYDPKKTSYELLVNYAYRNMDPFDGTGQFCDKGSSYYPAVFYETDDELEVAEDVLGEILALKGWEMQDIAAPILPRPVFWIAEDYHQDYYIKNPQNYGFYKNGCRRPQRLKEVWGEDEYKCYHEETHSCFVDMMLDITAADESDNTTISTVDVVTNGDASEQQPVVGTPQIVNADGELVAAESNIKQAKPETTAKLPRWAIVLICAVVGVVVLGLILFRYYQGTGSSK